MKKEKQSFTFIDLFAGIGGMRIGFEGIGGQCVFSSEWNRFSAETYEANFGEKPDGDITKIDAADIPDHDILVGGFPCQPFSIAGVSKKRSLNRPDGFMDETQGTLFFDIVRIIKAKKPQAFLLENVKNLKSHDKGNTFRVIEKALKGLGYDIHYSVIDAKHVVPQHRERIFIVGFQNPTDYKFPKIRNRNLAVKDILEDDVEEKYTLPDGTWNALQRHAKNSKAKGNGFGFGMTDVNGISRTLSARYYKDGAEVLIAQESGKNPRRLTPRECSRLMGFPKKFVIPVSNTQAYRQFGNAVVPLIVKEIAKTIVTQLVKPKKRIAITEIVK